MRARVKYWLAPDLRSVELIAADYVAQRFSPHWHTGFAVGVVTRNMQRFRADGRDWAVGPGDLILLNPGQLHDGSSTHVGGWTSRMAYIPETAFVRLTSAASCNEHMPQRFQTPVLHAPELATMFANWHCSSEGGHNACEAPCTADVLGALMRLMRPSPTGVEPCEGAVGVSFKLSERLRMLSEGDSTAIGERMSRLDVSRTTSWRQMRADLGLSRRALLTHLRLVSAKRFLAVGRPVVDTALEIGYHDQSHFTRQFAAAYGMTPAQFRRAQLEMR